MDKQILWKIVLIYLDLISVVICHGIIEPGSCIIRTRVLKAGDTFEPQACHILVCRNGSLSGHYMDPKDCPELPCEAGVQVSVPDRCCKICPGTLARCWFNGMTVESGDSFQLHPCGTCVCYDRKLSCDKTCPNELKPSASTALEGVLPPYSKHM